MEYYYLSVGLCGIVLLLKWLLRKRFLFFTPLTMYAVAWMLNAGMMFYVMAHPELKNNYGIVDFEILGGVLFYFILAGIGGCILAYALTGFRPFRAPDGMKEKEFFCKLEKCVNQFRIILIFNAIFGVFRFIIVFSYIGFTVFKEFRDFAALELSKIMPPWQSLIYQISNHLYILAGYYIVLYGAYVFFQKDIKWKTLFCNFLLFSVPLMATGGRLWILNFTVYFFAGILFTYSLFVRTQGRSKLLKNLFLLLVGLAFAICVIGELRSRSADYGQIVDGSGRSIWGKLTYATDGNVMLSNYIDFQMGGTAPIGSCTFGQAEPLQRLRSNQMYRNFYGYVDGMHSFLYFDFGIPGMYWVWFVICTVMESVAMRAISRMTTFSFLIGTILIKMMQESIIFNCIRGCYPYFEWIILLFLLSRIFQKKICRESSGKAEGF